MSHKRNGSLNSGCGYSHSPPPIIEKKHFIRRLQVAVVAIALSVLGAFLGCCDGGTESQGSDSSAEVSAQCGDLYPEQDTSPYILPYTVGTSFEIGQGNCTSANDSHAAGTADAFAYDIDMPIGTDVVAARGGTVLSIEERYVDGNRIPGEENFVNIRHKDGSVGVYFHLTRDGALVEVGATVRQGDIIAKSGDTGDSTEPHLHFQVDAAEGQSSVPVSFRNTRPHPNGLVEGRTYQAEPY